MGALHHHSMLYVVPMMCFLIIVIFYCYNKSIFPHFWNLVGRESNITLAVFPHIFRRAFSLGVAMLKRLDAAGVSSACFLSPYILREARIPAWVGRDVSRSSTMLGAGGVG